MKALSLLSVLAAMPLASCATIRNYELLQDYEITLASSNPEDTTVTATTATTDAQDKPGTILSAFFGLDDALPGFSDKAICDGAGGMDGMPVIFSHELDVVTMQAGDFKVTTASGKTGGVHCVTLAPADDKGELRTALLVGHYGSLEDQPVKVEIVGNLLSIDGSINFRGKAATVIPLEDGPTIILAELVPKDRMELGKPATELPFGGGSGCPVGTRQVVNVVWVGGVTKVGGDDADDKERALYKVTVRQADGREDLVTPFELADLGDGDNNHRLCLDVDGQPTSVFFPAGHLKDPRADPNPDTTMVITAP